MPEALLSKTEAAFRAAPLSDVPPPALREFSTIFEDVDYGGGGRPTASVVRAALAVNELDLSASDTAGLLSAMEALTAQLDDAAGVPRRGGVGYEAFARCLHAASVQHREVLPPAVYAVFPDSCFTAETATGLLRLRRRVWLVLDDPLSSRAALAVACLIVAAILVSTVAFCAETLPGVHMRYPQTFAAIETTCVAVFTAELVLRFACSPTPRTFFRETLNVVDLLSVLPFYLDLTVAAAQPSSAADAAVEESQGAAVLRAVRLVRIFRMVKLGRYVAWMRVFGKTLVASLAPLAMLLFVLCLVVLLTSSGAYYAERGVWDPDAQLTNGMSSEPRDGHKSENAYDDPAQQAGVVVNATGAWVNPATGEFSQFPSIPVTFWWCICTLTTVGYGDVVPITLAGRFVAVLAFFAGIVLTAMPIAIITSNFHGEYDHMKRLQAIKVTHAHQPAPAPNDPAIDAASARETAVFGLAIEGVAQQAAVAGMGGASVGALKEADAATTAPSDVVASGAEAAAAAVGVAATAGAAATVGAAATAGAAATDALREAAEEEARLAATAARVKASWSEPYLRSTLQVLRDSRRTLMSRLKAKELASREFASAELNDLIARTARSRNEE